MEERMPVIPKAAIKDYALVFAFCVAIATPLAITIGNLSFGATSPAEERLAPTPKWPADLFGAFRLPGQFKYYFQKRFGLRSWMVRLHGRLKVELLGTTSNPDVALGKDGWLFLESEGMLDFYRGTELLQPREIREWVDGLEEEREWLAGRGIKYLVVIAPNSQTIYPEYLPSDYVRGNAQTPTDQLVDALKARSSVDTLDLRPVLLAQKDEARLFHRTDTHWNLVGSWFGARAIIGRLGDGAAPGVIPLLSAGPIETKNAEGGDLARLLGISDVLREEKLQPPVFSDQLRDESGAPATWTDIDVLSRSDVVTVGQGSGPRAVLFRDSFGEALIPWLGPFFSRAIWRWTYGFDRELVEREDPDVVIRQFVERKIATVRQDGSSRALR
jgi:alginate O-acetyltransferase complex protein AlgJ